MLNKIKAALCRLLLIAFPVVSFGVAQQPQSYATTNADTLQAIINQHSILTSQHFVFIFNNSSAQNAYNYQFSLCAAQQPSCTTRSFTVYLQPHVGVNIYFDLTLDVLYTKPASYPILANTSITGLNTNISVNANSVIQVISP
jgi:hypothetical protein